MTQQKKRKVCSWCGKHRNVDMFYKLQDGKPRPECKECTIRARHIKGGFR